MGKSLTKHTFQDKLDTGKFRIDFDDHNSYTYS